MKHLLLFFLFITLPFSFLPRSQVIIAQSASPSATATKSAEPEPELNPWQLLWKRIGELFKFSWFTKDYPISCKDNRGNFTNYNADDKDAVARSPAEADQKFNKGTYLKKVIDGIYPDRTIAYFCGNTCTNTKSSGCSPIKFSNLIHYFYKKNQRILYIQSNFDTPIYYDSQRMEKYGYQIIPGTGHYFENLYRNMPSVPQGIFKEKKHAAAASSQQLNNNLRRFIPNSAQRPKFFVNLLNPKSVEFMIKENEEQQKDVFTNFIPEKNGVRNSGNNNQIKETFTDYMQPASW